MTEPQLRLQAQAAEAEGSPQLANSLFFFTRHNFLWPDPKTHFRLQASDA